MEVGHAASCHCQELTRIHGVGDKLAMLMLWTTPLNGLSNQDVRRRVHELPSTCSGKGAPGVQAALRLPPPAPPASNRKTTKFWLEGPRVYKTCWQNKIPRQLIVPRTLQEHTKERIKY
eukprot:3376670-Amphidinium_carterae.1